MRKTDRRSFLLALGTLASFMPSKPAMAGFRVQTRVKRIGFLIGEAPSLIAAFESELRRRGYEHGKNIVIEKRVTRTNTSDLNDFAGELAKMDLDLVLAASLAQALPLRRSNPNMPMVIATCPGMVSNGFAKSLDRPGGIYTGMDELPPGLTAKRLGLLKTAAPNITRVALLSTTPGVGGHETQLADAEKAAPSLKLMVKPYRATSFDQLKTALTNITEDRMDGMLNFQGGLSLAHRDLIVNFASEHRIPAIYQSRFFVEAGGLMSWAPDQEQQYRIAARYVARILKGAKPGDLPVQFPDRYYLTIKKAAADRIGLQLPSSLVLRARMMN